MIAEQASDTKLRLRSTLLKLGLALGVLVLGLALGSALTSPSWEKVITAVAWLAQMGTILLNPLGGLLLWVIASPYAPFVHLNLSLGAGIPDLGLDRISAGFFCMVLLAQVALRKRRLAPLTKLDGAIVVFALALALSARTALRGSFTALQTIFDAHLVPLLIYFLAKNLVYDRKAMRWVLSALSIIAGYLVVLTVCEHLTGNELFVVYGRVSLYGENLKRINSLLQNPAYIALALNMVLPFALRATFRTRDARERWGYGLATVVLLGTIVSLYNRAGWLSALLVIVASAVFYPRLRRGLLLVLVVTVPILALSWNIVSGSALFSERLTYELSVDYRMRAIDAVLQLVSRQPLFGIGFGSFSTLSLAEGLIAKYNVNYWVPTTHNSYMDVLASAGLSGLLPFLAIFAIIICDSWRLYRRARYEPAIDRSLIVALWCAFLAFTVTMATLDIVAAPFCGMVFWLIVGAVLGSQSWPTLWRQKAQRRAEAV